MQRLILVVLLAMATLFLGCPGKTDERKAEKEPARSANPGYE
jgi:hypothetical protein